MNNIVNDFITLKTCACIICISTINKSDGCFFLRLVRAQPKEKTQKVIPASLHIM